MHVWSFRGLSIYRRVTIDQVSVHPNLVYVASLLPTPANIFKQVEHIFDTFLWKGKDKETRLSAINNSKGSGIKRPHGYGSKASLVGTNFLIILKVHGKLI